MAGWIERYGEAAKVLDIQHLVLPCHLCNDSNEWNVPMVCLLGFKQENLPHEKNLQRFGTRFVHEGQGDSEDAYSEFPWHWIASDVAWSKETRSWDWKPILDQNPILCLILHTSFGCLAHLSFCGPFRIYSRQHFHIWAMDIVRSIHNVSVRVHDDDSHANCLPQPRDDVANEETY